jgi:hypothetical protein
MLRSSTSPANLAFTGPIFCTTTAESCVSDVLLELGASGDAGPQDVGVVQRLPYDGARRVDPVFTGHIHAGFPP